MLPDAEREHPGDAEERPGRARDPRLRLRRRRVDGCQAPLLRDRRHFGVTHARFRCGEGRAHRAVLHFGGAFNKLHLFRALDHLDAVDQLGGFDELRLREDAPHIVGKRSRHLIGADQADRAGDAGQEGPHAVDGERLNAVRALVDHGDAGIAHELLHAVLGDVAVAAEDLLRLDGVVEADVGEDALQHRRHQAEMVVGGAALLPDGRTKLILKDPATGDYTDRVVAGRPVASAAPRPDATRPSIPLAPRLENTACRDEGCPNHSRSRIGIDEATKLKITAQLASRTA